MRNFPHPQKCLCHFEVLFPDSQTNTSLGPGLMALPFQVLYKWNYMPFGPGIFHLAYVCEIPLCCVYQWSAFVLLSGVYSSVIGSTAVFYSSTSDGHLCCF